MRPARTVGAALFAIALLVGGCADGSQPAEGNETEQTATSPDPTDAPPSSSFESIAALHDAIVAAGFACELEYEGLRDEDKELSICFINGEQALLTIWLDPGMLEDFVGSEIGRAELNTAVGENWSIDLATPETTRALAEALGGRVSGSG